MPSPRRPRSLIDLRVVPAPVRYGGMPASRCWEMEDARIDLGVTEAGPLDLGRLLLVQFATVFGNDWFVIPLPVVSGSRSRSTR